jgi:hypothetical protein
MSGGRWSFRQLDVDRLYLNAGYARRVQKKTEHFAMKTLFYILSTVPFKVVPSTGDTLFPIFLPLLECTFCDDAQFSFCIFLNLRVLKKRPNFLNRAPTSTEGML